MQVASFLTSHAGRRGGIALAVVALLAVMLAVGFTQRSGDQPNSGGNPRHREDFGVKALPPSLEEVVAGMEFVVRGKYERVVDVRQYERKLDGPQGKSVQVLPITRMVFLVDEWIVGEGPDEIVVSQYGDVPEGLSVGTALPEFGRTITLIGTPWNIDPNFVHPIFGDYGRLDESGGQVNFAFVEGGTGQASYIAGITLAEVHELLRDGARSRGLRVGP